MPEKDSYLNFQNYKKMFSVPFVFYADFQSFTQKIPSTQPNPKYFSTFNYQKHQSSGNKGNKPMIKLTLKEGKTF